MSRRSAGRKTKRRPRAARRGRSIVTLSKGDEFVRFDRTRGDPHAIMINSAGESARIPVDDARKRISTLVGAGWILGGAGGTPRARAMIEKSRAQLDREIAAMLRTARLG